MINFCWKFFTLCLLVVVVSWFNTSVYAKELNLAVANSTCDAVKKVGELYEQQHDVNINYICKSSGRLAKGLVGEAIQADIYISANRSWMDYMLDNGLASPKQVSSPWGNALVVATAKHSLLKINDLNDLLSEKINTILIGDPGTAPFGRYAKETLQATGHWSRVRHKIETKKHITLLAETLAEADVNTVGILFVSNINSRHRIIYPIDKSLHTPIKYYLAPVKNTSNETLAVSLLDFIHSPAAQKIFRAEGFEINSP